MSDPSAFGFGQFVPGFDFLQNLSKTASQAQPAAAGGMPGMASWVAPTLNIEEIDKRIQELKSVLFWLEQNTTTLKATIQAMEVQKMTLTTLQGMNVNMADLAKAFTVKPPATEPAPSPATGSPATAGKTSLFTPKPAADAQAEAAPDPRSAIHREADSPAQTEAPSAAQSETHARTDAGASESANATGKPAVDPMQWWGALTQQFQGIAAAALKDVAGEALKAGMASKPAKSAKSSTGRSAAAKAGKGTAAPSRAKAPRKAVPAKAPATAARKSASAAPAKAVQPKAKSTARKPAKP